jgi:hypothetical protein
MQVLTFNKYADPDTVAHANHGIWGHDCSHTDAGVASKAFWHGSQELDSSITESIPVHARSTFNKC